MLFKTTNEGDSYTAISPDLSRNDPRTLGPSGGQITKDQTGVETYGTVFAMAESPVTKGVIWAGTDDGTVHVTRNGGVSWTAVGDTPYKTTTVNKAINVKGSTAGAVGVMLTGYTQTT